MDGICYHMYSALPPTPSCNAKGGVLSAPLASALGLIKVKERKTSRNGVVYGSELPKVLESRRQTYHLALAGLAQWMEYWPVD